MGRMSSDRMISSGMGMRAAVLEGARGVRVMGVEVPEPGPGEVRIRLEGCGVCASNLPVWEGRSWFDYPLPAGAPGHEGWGRIDAVGEGVRGLEVGERVAFLSSRAYAEYDIASSDSVVLLPDELVGRPFPGEALGCAMNVFRRSGIVAGQRVAIVGIGFLGAVLTSLAASVGAEVIAGYHQDGDRRVDMQLWNWRGLDVINAHEREPAVYLEGMRTAIAAILAGQLDPWPLFTHTFELDELDHALEAVEERPRGS